jgi:hypothetical protein
MLTLLVYSTGNKSIKDLKKVGAIIHVSGHWVLVFADRQRRILFFYDPYGRPDRHGFSKTFARYLNHLEIQAGVPNSDRHWQYYNCIDGWPRQHPRAGELIGYQLVL